MSDFEKCVFRFGNGVVDGAHSTQDVLGGKGAGLQEMVSLGLPVPAGFTIDTSVCRHYLKYGSLPAKAEQQIANALSWLETSTGRYLDCPVNPLLVSVRSGAPISMPGMMDTILNVGLTEASVKGFGLQNGSRKFALDSYRRLMQMFGVIVFKIPQVDFARILAAVLETEDVDSDSELSEDAIGSLADQFAALISSKSGDSFPQRAHDQLTLAIETVFSSWQSGRALHYRRLNNIPEEMGTAVTVQAMVFGNRGMSSGTGVGFTRNPSTGARELFGEFLMNAQGEEIVAGTRTPMPIAELARTMPDIFRELDDVTQIIERCYRDVQDFEFTIEDGKLFLLQTRSAKRTAFAAVQNAVDMVAEGIITKREAIARITPVNVADILSPQLDLTSIPDVLTQGIPASSGAAAGIVALSADQAVQMASGGDRVILVTKETSADDIHGMAASIGFLTACGGATSHAAVVARGMGKCCITGAREVRFDEKGLSVTIGTHTFKAGDWLTLDGSTGRVFEGRLGIHCESKNHPGLDTLLDWARDISSIGVHANADTPKDAIAARLGKAAGIGLCRTEHMFFAPERLSSMRAMITATNVKDRTEALALLLPAQQQDFEGLFREMAPLPVTIRLLDPPLHEFLPSLEEINADITYARRDENWEHLLVLESLRERVQLLRESNPMMGHRGCRLSLTYPEILQMQVRAILQAALMIADEGLDVFPEIMIPLVASAEEARVLVEMIHQAAAEVLAGHRPIQYSVGTMIELPRAAICAGQISRYVDFVSFGTNDLTQMTYGFSRDDSHTYLKSYLDNGIFKKDPFVTIDESGVGYLLKMAIAQIRSVDPSIKIGVCGEHAGDPDSIRFFSSIGVDYISCSPSRLAIAHLSAAQANNCERTQEAAEISLPVLV